jgi:2-oxo-3-hexenedioate decarboxylase
VSTERVRAFADELSQAYASRTVLPVPLSTREPGFDLTLACAIEAELTRRRRASGRTTVGRKVGYASKAVWRALKLDTLVWAHMYDDTVVATAAPGSPHPPRSLSTGRMCSPRIEPEVVFKLRAPVPAASQDPAEILGAVEWIALGFEIVDSVYADWKFQPADFVAACGLHAALVVGEPRDLPAADIPALVDQLAQFRVRLLKNGEVAAEGSGRNALRSPALCLGELASAIAKRPGEEPLLAGELVSSGTLTEPQPIADGETWTASVEGIDLPSVTLHVVV